MIGIILAATITLTPFETYLGVFPSNTEKCQFSFSAGTKLTSGTRLNIDPYVNELGNGSWVEPRDYYSCGKCAVTRYHLDSSGKTTFDCAPHHKY